jgi:hypothetical protein
MQAFRYGVVLVLVCGCREVPEATVASPIKIVQLQIRDEASRPGLVADLDVGADCRVGGRGRCRSGQCLHSGLESDDVYFCSSECVADRDCPEDWSCQRVEGLGKAFCAAPTMKAGWVHGTPKQRVLTQRAASRPVMPQTFVVADAGVR